MRSLMAIIGVILIIIGVVTFAYQGITYTTTDKIAQIGSVQITAEKEKTIWFPPVLGGASLAVGLVLVIVSRMGRPK